MMQPKDMSFVDGALRIKWNSSFGIETEKRIHHAQRAIDSECIKYMVPYTPRRNGFLEESVKLGTVIGSGEIRYLSPYARYLYYGEIYGPNIPIYEEGQNEPVGYFSPKGKHKHPTGREMKYDTSRHSMAGKLWFERMKSDHLDDILESAQKAVRGK